jgi:[acyl-carrier-protein] S-malonyltransferase
MAGGAFLFPGQGTQRPGMAERLRQGHGTSRMLFAVASELLGRDLATLCRRGPEAALRATDNAQPALFVTGCAYAAWLADLGVAPMAAAGHSVGELCALVTAGVLDFERGVELVGARGRLMARARRGAMASVIGLDATGVARLVAGAGDPDRDEPLVVAVINSPADVVVSGHPAAVERAVAAAAGRPGIVVRRLRVEGAFHSPLMEPIAAEWAEHVRAVPLAPPRLPVALNATGALARTVDDVRAALAAHLTAPVRWADCVRALLDAGVDFGVECGDSRSLRRINAALGLDTRAAERIPVGAGVGR